MMLTKIMFRFSILICAVAATTLSIEAQESKPRGLAGTVNGSAGQNDVKWDSRGMGSGLYFVVVETWDGGRLLDRTISKLIVRK